jgi:DNA repair photolyase
MAIQTQIGTNIIRMPSPGKPYGPIEAEMREKISKIQDSKYTDTFDYSVYDKIANRYDKMPRGGVVFGSWMALKNFHASCQQCHYTFEIDTYGRGCWHNCVYCYAKDQLTTHGYWNNPQPMPMDIAEMRKVFYTVFETDKRSKWRAHLERRIPVRLGSMSDCFMWMDKQYKVTKEAMKILNFYRYPNIIFTKSDMVADDEYMGVMDKDLTSVQMSISSLNEKLNRRIEPAAPPAAKRLRALQKMSEAGFNTAVRINPLFPIYADGYYTDDKLPADKKALQFDYFSWDMPHVIAQHKVKTLLAGVVRLSGFELNQIQKAAGIDLRPFFSDQVNSGSSHKRYSDAEIRYYYERLYRLCKDAGLQFTTCYIGNGEKDYWQYQNLWSNKKDCCNAVNQIEGFKDAQTARDIPWNERMKHSSCKTITPESDRVNVKELLTRNVEDKDAVLAEYPEQIETIPYEWKPIPNQVTPTIQH